MAAGARRPDRAEAVLTGAAAGARANPRVEAWRILQRVLGEGASSSRELARARVASGVDHSFVTELVLGTLRRLGALDDAIASVSRRSLARIEPRLLAGLRLGALQLLYLDRVPDHAAVSQTVGLLRKHLGAARAGFANGVLRGLARRRDGAGWPTPAPGIEELTARLSLPEWLASRWLARYGVEATRRLAEAALETPELTLRVRPGRMDEVRERLAAAGLEARPGRYLPEALRTSGAAACLDLFREGLAMVQDEGAQLVAALVAPDDGSRVLDACAAPGGKTVAVADAARVELVVALEARVARLGRLVDNLRANGQPRIAIVHGDAERPGLRGGFDRILVDAPCSGTGTIRRKPEIRYRVDADSLRRSGRRGFVIADAMAALLAPGGRLIHATCSLEPEENEAVIEALLRARPELTMVDARGLLPAAAAGLVGTDGVLRTQPADVAIDGFTAFVLVRREDDR